MRKPTPRADTFEIELANLSTRPAWYERGPRRIILAPGEIVRERVRSIGELRIPAYVHVERVPSPSVG